MPEFTRPGFNRRYVLLPMLAVIALVTVGFLTTEIRREGSVRIANNILDAQERMRMLAEVIYAAADAESGQRGYLIAREPEYLQQYDEAKERLAVLLPQLHSAYQNDAAEAPHIATVEALIKKKLVELGSSVELFRNTGSTSQSVRLVRSGVGLRWMSQVRDEIESIRTRERQRIYHGIVEWQQQRTVSRYVASGAALLNIMLLLVAGAYITRDIERRNAAAGELDRLVAQRTVELSELSTHLQRATERERSQLARELHDELGGLLVAIKMDLAQLAKKFDITHPDIQLRWQRIQNAISAGVDLKRRVIEELRPTLLDNMGLIAALRWQAEQTCSQAGITLRASFPEEEPELDTNTSIAIFRVAQESLTNIVKHARATAVGLTLHVIDGGLTLTIQDNGVGLSSSATERSGAHGLLSMKHRVRAIGGTFFAGSVEPHGTRIVVRVPFKLAGVMAMLE
jgi:signal transduction histidine kinase